MSLFLPPGLRATGGKPHGPAASTKVRPVQRPDCGIGIVLDQTEDGRLVVELVWPGSPAAIAGMCLGDVLLLIDGMQGSVSSVDVARDLILGAEGTMVTLQVLRGITQLEFGPVARIPWATMQQVLLPSRYSFSPSFLVSTQIKRNFESAVQLDAGPIVLTQLSAVACILQR